MSKTISKTDPLQEEKEALLRERAIRAERLAQPKIDQRRIEEIDKRLIEMERQELPDQFVCLGVPYRDDRGIQKFSTAVEHEGKIVKLPPNCQFDETGLPITQAEFTEAFEQGRVYQGGRETVVTEEKAEQLRKAGLTVVARKQQPSVTFGSRQHLVANTSV